MKVARKRGHDDPPVAVKPENFLERPAEDVLGQGEPLPLDVRRIGQHEKHALAPDVGEAAVVGQTAVNRGRIELEVARMHDGPERRLHGESDAVGDRVTDRHKAYRERTERNRLSGLDLGRLHLVGRSGLFEFMRDHRKRQTSREDRDIQFRQHERERAGMVFVAVRDDRADDAMLVLHKVGDIGDDEIDAEHLLVGEFQS